MRTSSSPFSRAKGHPVAGVSVYLNGRSIGITDSHGQWRRFMAVESNRQLEIKFIKKDELRHLQGNLHVAVPQVSQSSNEFSVHRRILLATNDESDPVSSTSNSRTLTSWVSQQKLLPSFHHYFSNPLGDWFEEHREKKVPALSGEKIMEDSRTLYELFFGAPSFTIHSYQDLSAIALPSPCHRQT